MTYPNVEQVRRAFTAMNEGDVPQVRRQPFITSPPIQPLYTFSSLNLTH